MKINKVRKGLESLSDIERHFWLENLNLLIDDPEYELNNLIRTLRRTAEVYFQGLREGLSHKLLFTDIEEHGDNS